MRDPVPEKEMGTRGIIGMEKSPVWYGKINIHQTSRADPYSLLNDGLRNRIGNEPLSIAGTRGHGLLPPRPPKTKKNLLTE
jgi:hypothetical protein